MNQTAQSILQAHDNLLATHGIVRMSAAGIDTTPEQRLGNVRLEIDRLLNPTNADARAQASDDLYVACRIGFIHGVLYSTGLMTIEAINDQARAIQEDA